MTGGTSSVQWQVATFPELSSAELYAVLAARQQVFVLEQQCFYNDFDGLDQVAHHLIAWQEGEGYREIAAYLRVLPPGAKYDEKSIGRVLTTQAARGSGIGRELMARGVALADELYPSYANRIGAQAYLEKFYASFGFATITAPYDEDGILHVDMLRPAP